MLYRVEFKSAARKVLAGLDKPLRTRLAAAIEDLRRDPRPNGSAKLQGEDIAWRVRVGDYRVIYEIHEECLLVLVVKVGHRREVYRGL